MADSSLLIFLMLAVLVIIILALLVTLLIGWVGHMQTRPDQHAAPARPKQQSPNVTIAAMRSMHPTPTISTAGIHGEEDGGTHAAGTQEITTRAQTDTTEMVRIAPQAITADEKLVGTEASGNVEISTDAANTSALIPRRIISYLDLNRKQRSALRNQAQVDYEQARGASHQRILTDARQQLVQEKQRLEKQLKDLQNQLEVTNNSHQAELRRTLEHYLIYDRFDEVDGIGNSLKTRILDAVRPITLNDLRRADAVPGVGQSRMAAIESWIYRYHQQMPLLLSQSFPGREAIDRRFMDQKSMLQKDRERAQATLASLGQRMAQVDQDLSWLKAVSVETYMAAIQGKPDAQAQVMRHTIGVFAEWEPIPAWFKQILDGKGFA